MEGSEVGKDSEYGEAMERMEKGEGWDKVVADMQHRESASPEASDVEE
jgi:hypothetical protein